MDSKKFGNELRKVLDDKGIKYSYVAEKMGWSRQLLHAKMLGQSAWRLDEVSKVMKLLNLPVDMLEQ